MCFLFRARYFDPKMANIATIFLCSKKWSNRKNKATFTLKKFRAREVKVTLFLRFDRYFTQKWARS